MGDAMRTARRRELLDLGFGLAILVVTSYCSAQEGTEANPSLGDVARQVRAVRAQEKSHPCRVYTNDDFSPHLSSEAATAQSGPGSTAKPENENGPPLLVTSGVTPSASESYYRAKMKQLRRKLAADQESLQDTLAKIRQTWDPSGYYTGDETPADKSPFYVPYHLDELNQYQKLKAIRASIDEDENAISALEDQCRRDGCSPGWLR